MSSLNESSRSVLLVGGPDSGKTNFLSRLWLAIKGGGLVQANGTPDHLEYLKSGADKLLAGEFVDHTPHDVYKENSIPCRIDRNGKSFLGVLVVPDCWGEKWMEIYKKREWSQQWENQISESCSCLVFVRASSEQMVAPIDWIQCEKLWGMPLAEAEVHDKDPPPTQVVLTDLLQFLEKAFKNRVGRGYRPRIGIVVAAWDLVPTDRQKEGPGRYIAREFPLLHQFLQSNDDTFEFASFGISIAGGDFVLQPGFKDKCLALDDPLELGYVVYDVAGKTIRKSDLTLPVAWGMGASLLSES
jgi:hypothetical protein